MKYFIARTGSGKGRGNATPRRVIAWPAILKYFETLKQGFKVARQNCGQPPRAVQYIMGDGQRFVTASGRAFALSVQGGRIELVENTGEAFVLVEHYRCKPSAALVLKIGALVVGERLKTASI